MASASLSNSISFHFPHPTPKTHLPKSPSTTFRPTIPPLSSSGHRFRPPLSSQCIEATSKASTSNTEDKPNRFKWGEIDENTITEAEQEAIDELPARMSKRCQAVMKQIICYKSDKGSLGDVLSAWVSIMKPCRADWLAVLKELRVKDHPLYLQVAEIAVWDDSFEPNVCDYTKIIHGYGKKNRIEDAENTLSFMKSRGFLCDQVTLTTMIDMYSKAGHLKLAEDTFEEIKLLGEQVDKRSYGSMIMAYIRAGMPEKGEILLLEMDVQEIVAGSEIYKALLRAYSMVGDTEGSQRVFNALQLSGISPDAKICGLLINAYGISGQSQKARAAFENMKKAGLKPTDKCIALTLAAYEKENKLQMALKFLMDLEREGILVGKEAAETLAGWFRKLGVVEEVNMVFKEFAAAEASSGIPTS